MNQTALEQEALPDRVACLVATLSDRKLLLPITAVAEVINTVTMPEAGQDNSALYGWIRWREQRIPLLSFEAALGGDKPALKFENRMAVLNGIGDARDIGYYAILLQGLPKPVQVNAETIREDESSDNDQFTLAQAAVGEDRVVIPNLMAVEAIAASFAKK